MKYKVKWTMGLLGLLLTGSLYGQQMPEVAMADELRANGKIYVVVLIIGIIFAGIIAYLIHLDRKISKLEKQQK